MASLTISLLAVLICLLAVRQLQSEIRRCNLERDYLKKRCVRLETMYDAAVNNANRMAVDVVTLRASLKHKHPRVPKL